MSCQEVRCFDRWAIETLGISGAVLMENAGRSCAVLVREKLAEIGGGCVGIICRTGNNGGDGYVIARHLANAGVDVKVAICGERSKVEGDALANLAVIERMGVGIEEIGVVLGAVGERVAGFCSGCDVVVDALLGTGVTGMIRDEYIELIEAVNGVGRAVIAVDIPSGLDCDKGVAMPVAIKAVATVTFVAVKKGFAVPGSMEYTGDVFVASIGIEPGFQSDITCSG